MQKVKSYEVRKDTGIIVFECAPFDAYATGEPDEVRFIIVSADSITAVDARFVSIKRPPTFVLYLRNANASAITFVGDVAAQWFSETYNIPLPTHVNTQKT